MRNMKIVTEWTSSDRTFRIGDVVKYISRVGHGGSPCRGVITSIEVCDSGDGHVILDSNPNTLTDFCFMEFDKSYYRNRKLEELGILK